MDKLTKKQEFEGNECPAQSVGYILCCLWIKFRQTGNLKLAFIIYGQTNKETDI